MSNKGNVMCYGKKVENIDVVQNKYGQVRCLVQYKYGTKTHDVSVESISWQSSDWNEK